jgi:hypothetical protein
MSFVTILIKKGFIDYNIDTNILTRDVTKIFNLLIKFQAKKRNV